MSKLDALAAHAHHEAGHAVAAVLKGFPFKYTTIAPDNDHAGHLRWSRLASGFEAMHNHGLVALAGDASQRRFKPPGSRGPHDHADREVVVAAALEIVPSTEQVQILVRLWEVQARELVEAHWSTIQIVAEELLRRKTLSMGEVRALALESR